VASNREFASAFRHPEFRLLQGARLSGIIALQIQNVAIGWDVYRVSGNPLYLGYVGLAQFLPVFLLAPLTGAAADRFERRRILVLCHATLAVAALLLSLVNDSSLPAVYALLSLVGAARAFTGPSASALLVTTVPPKDFSNAVAWSSSVWQVATIAGPALGGVLYLTLGSGRYVYAVCSALELIAMSLVVFMKRRPAAAPQTRASARDLLAGLHFVGSRRLLLSVISLDMFAVLLGGAVALLPAVARDVLDVGPGGLGLLRSAPAVGAALVALGLAFRPIHRRAGLTMLLSVGGFGLCTIGFGWSRHFVASLGLLVLMGAFDMVSVFVRQNIVQLSTPDAMRGRVNAVNLVFVGASNELGELESGVTAAWFGVVPAILVGGVGTVLVVVLWALLFPSLRGLNRLDADSLGTQDGSDAT